MVVTGAFPPASSDTPVAVQPIDVVPLREQSKINVCVALASGAMNLKFRVEGPFIMVNGWRKSHDAVAVSEGQAMR